MQDTYKMKGLRARLVKVLQKKGISDEQVLDAIGKIPRHLFLDKAFWEWAYKDQAFPIAAEQTISQPFTVAVQTSLLELNNSDKVLEIGTGSGYQASVLSLICKKVYTIERHKILHRTSSALLRSLGYINIRTFFGDGYAGLPNQAPFDKIIVTAGASSVPQGLIQQLAVGGLMIIPVGDDATQEMLRIKRIDENTWTKEHHGTFKFVPFLNGSEDNPKYNQTRKKATL